MNGERPLSGRPDPGRPAASRPPSGRPPSGRPLEDLESAVERLLAAYRAEKAKTRELMIQVAELEARLARSPAALGELQDENRRLKRNAAVAAERLGELLERL